MNAMLRTAIAIYCTVKPTFDIRYDVSVRQNFNW